ncbi:hypothetical protein [Saccharopolyspora spinosa]|uniref:hypothetical protein n=1 Tax=Saccharopolyspora spinosa TaxID=60894 RepID=UPI0013054586|nr:hypothetical protein [Saccharopolyspora spinosa]
MPTMQEWGAWTLGDVVDYVAGNAVPADAPDEEVVRHLGAARAAELTSVDESRAQAWLDGSDHGQPFSFQLRGMREAARLPSSELVRYLGPGRAIEVTGGVVSERGVWAWLEGASAPRAEDAGTAAPQRAGELGRPPSRRQLNVLHELVQALDGREIDYLTSFFGTDSLVAVTIGGLYQWRRSDRAMLRGVVLDTIVAAFGGPVVCVFEVHDEILCGLGDPRGRRVCGGAQDPDPPGGVFDDGEDVHPCTG